MGNRMIRAWVCAAVFTVQSACAGSHSTTVAPESDAGNDTGESLDASVRLVAPEMVALLDDGVTGRLISLRTPDAFAPIEFASHGRLHTLRMAPGGRFALAAAWVAREWIDSDGEDQGTSEPTDVVLLDLEAGTATPFDVVGLATAAAAWGSEALVFVEGWRFRHDRAAVLVSVVTDPDEFRSRSVMIDLSTGVATRLAHDECWRSEFHPTSAAVGVTCRGAESWTTFIGDLDTGARGDVLGVEPGERIEGFARNDGSAILTLTPTSEYRVRAASGELIASVPTGGAWLVATVGASHAAFSDPVGMGGRYFVTNLSTLEETTLQECDFVPGTFSGYMFQAIAPDGAVTALLSCDQTRVRVMRGNEERASYPFPGNHVASYAFDSSGQWLLVQRDVRYDGFGLTHVGAYEILDTVSASTLGDPRPSDASDTAEVHFRYVVPPPLWL